MFLYGHRGARGEAPENTVEGCLYAWHLGLRGFELDVRVTADGDLAVIHDSTVDRTTDGSGLVADLTMGELALLDARRDCAEWPVAVRVPTLREVLDALGGKAALEIEVKADSPALLEQTCHRLTAILRDYEAGAGVVVISFDPQALALMRRLAPGVPLGYLARDSALSNVETAFELGCRQVEVKEGPQSDQCVARARELGLWVNGPANGTPAALEAWYERGVPSATTDYPRQALALLNELETREEGRIA